MNSFLRPRWRSFFATFFSGKVYAMPLPRYAALRRLIAVTLALLFAMAAAGHASLSWTYNAATDVPVTANGYSASGTATLTLNFAPTVGTTLIVVNNTGLPFINGAFTNLAQGQAIGLTYNGVTYNFVANYYGGSGNDLALQWANVRPLAWGDNTNGELGNNNSTSNSVPVLVSSSGVLAGKTVVALAAGFSHSLALCSDGTVAAWGYNGYGQLGNNSATNSNVPVLVSASGVLADKTVVAIAAGFDHSLALCSDGTVVAWGNDRVGELGDNSTTSKSVPVLVSTSGVLAGKTVVAVAAGNYHSLALCSDGTLAAWGANNDGQLGNNSTTNSSVPVLVNTSGILTGKTVVAVAVGDDFSLVRCSDGTLAAWGDNGYGELGNSGTTSSSLPVLVNTSGVLTGKTVAAVAAGDDFNLALCSDGTLAAWGGNANGQLGNNGTTGSTVPASVNTSGVLAGKTVTSIAAGVFHSLALCSDGTLATWGDNYSGDLGNNGYSESSVPVLVNTTGVLAGKRVVAVAAGYDFSLALCSDGTVASWGSNSFGELGNSGTGNASVPVPVSISGVLAAKTVVAIAEGSECSLALCSDGTLATWGDNEYGQLGNNGTSASSVPVLVSTAGVLAGKTVVAVAAGEFHSLALCSDGTVAAWGVNGDGELGNNSTTNSSVPVLVSTAGVLAGKTVVGVAAGAYHSVALCSDGTVAAWGFNGAGELGNNSIVGGSSVPMLVSANGVLAGKTVVAIAAGHEHSLALCSDGTVASWGANYSGQLGNNSTSQSSVPVRVSTGGVLSGKTVVAVAAGYDHNLALCSDGTLVAWGYNGEGELGNNNPNQTMSGVPVFVSTSGVLAGRTVVAIAAGQNYSLALCSDGELAAWGNGSAGQLGNGSFGFGVPAPVLVSTAALATGERWIQVGSGPGAISALALSAAPPCPIVSTLAASFITATSATLNGTVNASNNSTTASFDYGTSTSYGTNVTGTPTPVTGASATAVSAGLTGLTPGTSYHFRVDGASAAGTSNGGDLSFTTLTTLQGWRLTYYGTTNNSGNAADNADPYGAGIPNLAAFAFFGPDQNPAHVWPGALPQPQMSGGNLFFSFNQPAGVSGITYGAEWSTTLLSNDWHAITDTGSAGQHLFSVPIGSNAQLFIRLKVTEP